MAVSTEETVRDVIVAAFRAIATDIDGLEFSEPEGNIKDYFLEFEDEALAAKYLMANIDGKKVVRCIAVDVRGNDDWWAAGDMTKRRYSIRVRMYYERGISGEGYRLMVKHARKLRGAIRGLTMSLGGTVSLVSSTGEIDVQQARGVDPVPGVILVGTMAYVAERTNPDF